MLSLFPISPGLATSLAACLLAILLGAAIVRDVRTHRIPNRLVLFGFVGAMVLSAVAPYGEGYFAASHAGGPGMTGALLGAATGFGAFLPLYLFRAMGAGDVKLMAMTGAFLAPYGAAEAALLTLAFGGFISVLVAAWNGVLKHAVANVRFMLTDALVRSVGARTAAIEPALSSAGKVPYAIAIGAGTAAHVALCRMQYQIF
ncbi:MAG: prepilin peptidase [Rhodospirillaceae bacterium]